MAKSFTLRRVVSAGFVIALLVVAFGILRVFETISHYNELAAIPIEPLVNAANNNPTDATTLILLDKQKKDALIERSQALSIIGFGAVLLGIVGLAYDRLPKQSKSQSAPQPLETS